MHLKPPLTIEEQIALLQSRGMIISQPQQAEAFLLNNNYYRLNIYFHKFMGENEQFHENTRFEHIVEVYKNDQWLRNRLLSVLEPIEIGMRSQVAYHLAMKYGADCFYRQENFRDSKIYSALVTLFSKEITRNKKDPVIRHHRKVYAGQYPIWVVVEYLSFNSVSRLFSNLHTEDMKDIAGSTFGINEDFLAQWLHVLSVLRNICAHYGYLFERRFSLRPRLMKEFGWDRAKNDRLFAQMLTIKKLTSSEDWNPFIRDIQQIDDRRASFSLEPYGFPSNWKDYLT